MQVGKGKVRMGRKLVCATKYSFFSVFKSFGLTRRCSGISFPGKYLKSGLQNMPFLKKLFKNMYF